MNIRGVKKYCFFSECRQYFALLPGRQRAASGGRRSNVDMHCSGNMIGSWM